MKTRDIGWLAGLLEGEGCFAVASSRSPVLALRMTDRDVVEHAARLLGAELKGPYPRVGRQPIWHCTLFGNKAAAWMMTLYPLLATRRRAKISECLQIWRSYVAHCKDREFCKRGHALSGDNVLAAQWTDVRGAVHRKARRCRECHNAYVREWRRQRAA